MKSFFVTQDCNLKKFTDFNYPQGAFYWNALLDKRDIKVNGVRACGDMALRVGDEVKYYTTPAQESAPSHYVVYQDKNVLVADKLSGVTSEGLLAELCAKGEFLAVHRLDRNTQGLLIFAKSAAVQDKLIAAFRERRVEKIYLALCKNCFKRQEDILCAYLKKDADGALVKIYDRACGEKIITRYKVLNSKGDLALVEIELHTGKTHQIRAHMAHIGCPVLGDEKYGDGALNKKYNARRQRLVAKYLKFNITGELEYLNLKTFESRFLPEE